LLSSITKLGILYITSSALEFTTT